MWSQTKECLDVFELGLDPPWSPVQAFTAITDPCNQVHLLVISPTSYSKGCQAIEAMQDNQQYSRFAYVIHEGKHLQFTPIRSTAEVPKVRRDQDSSRKSSVALSATSKR